MDKRTIIFRADGSESIGMGHFVRTLALAEMLNENFHCVYATQTPSQYQINEIEKVCHERIDLPIDKTHFNVFLDYLKGDEIVVLDNYYFTTRYQREIKNKGCRLVCIDDLHDKHFVADIVINHAEGINAEEYSIEPSTKLCLGYKYALLRKEFLNYPEKTKEHQKYSVFIMMGGADPYNLSSHLLKLFENIRFRLPIAVVIGSGNNNILTQTKTNQTIIFKNISSVDIHQLLNESELCIIPSSTVAVEACATRVPFICGYFIDNQIQTYEGIKKNKLAVCVDNFFFLTLENLTEAVNELRDENIVTTIINNQKKYLDKNSPTRIQKLFSEL